MILACPPGPLARIVSSRTSLGSMSGSSSVSAYMGDTSD